MLFSYSTQTLDILQKFLAKLNYSFLRLDGKTNINDRGKIIEEFHNDKSKFIFLISTKAGGLGLNLTGIINFPVYVYFNLNFLISDLLISIAASVVVVFDTSWNVSNDLQAQDRAHRLGQTMHTEVFRFVSAGTIEELV